MVKGLWIFWYNYERTGIEIWVVNFNVFGILHVMKCVLAFCHIWEPPLLSKQNGDYFLNIRQKALSCWMFKQSVDEKLSLEHSDPKDMYASWFAWHILAQHFICLLWPSCSWPFNIWWVKLRISKCSHKVLKSRFCFHVKIAADLITRKMSNYEGRSCSY